MPARYIYSESLLFPDVSPLLPEHILHTYSSGNEWKASACLLELPTGGIIERVQESRAVNLPAELGKEPYSE